MTGLVAKKVDSLWLNAHLATMQGRSYGIIRDGALATRHGKIYWIGPRKDLPTEIRNNAAQIHDGEGQWITPGLVDCHTHLIYAGTRAREFELRLQGASYEQIALEGGGILSTVMATREADDHTLFSQSAKRLVSMLDEGVTTLEIKSGYGLDLETEIRLLRVARNLGKKFPVTIMPTFLGAHVLPPEYQGKSDAYIDFLCEEVMAQIAEQGLATAVDAFCESIAFSTSQVERIFRSAARYGLRVKLHAEQLSNQGGASLAARYGALSVDHLEYLSEEGVKAIAESGTVAVLLPGAFYFLREKKVPPVDLLRRYAVPMAISSDCNPGTSPVTSPLMILNMGCTLFLLTPEEALCGMTINAARALGLEKRIGSLESGMDADFVLWEISEPSELAYRIGYNPCLKVVKHGTVVRSRP